MIARLRAWLDRPGPTRDDFEQVAQLAALQARIDELEQKLSLERKTTAHLTSENRDLARSRTEALHRADTAEGIAARVRADAEFVAAARCECGGDTELHWRTRARALEVQAERDRANAVRMADQIERLQAKLDEAERIAHIAEQQLERAR